MIDEGKMKRTAGGMLIGDAMCLTDSTPLEVARGYRSSCAKSYAFIDPPKLAPSVRGKDCHVSRKYDGTLCVLAKRGGKAILVTPGGTVRSNLKLLDEAVSVLPDDIFVPGELYWRRPDGTRERVFDVSAHGRNPASREDADRLAFAAFQVSREGSELYRFEQGRKRVEELANGDLFHVADGKWCAGEDVKAFFDDVIAANGEGVVVVCKDGPRFKVKPRHSVDLAVVGYATRADNPAEIHDLLLAVMRPDETYHIVGHVGGGFSDQERIDLLTKLAPLACDSAYATASSERVGYQFVRPETVVEISALDFFTHGTDGSPIEQMALDYSPEDGWKQKALWPIVSIYSPQFVRVRDDKSGTDQLDVRAKQIADLAGVDVESPISIADLASAEIVRREVHTKETKGQRCVRKAFLLRHPEEKVAAGFPRFCVVGTDYSPDRAEPLKMEMKASNDETQATEFFEDLLAAQAKKGWASVTPVTA